MKHADRSVLFSIGLLIMGATLVGLFNGEDLNPVLGSVPCGITSGDHKYHQGANDLDLFITATGMLHGVMLFVDFSDVESSQSTHELFEYATGAPALVEKLSYGRMSLQLTPIHTWYRMPKPSTDYGFEQNQILFSEAMGVADSEIDFSQYDFVVVAIVDNALTGNAIAAVRPSGEGIPIDEVEIRHAILVGGGMLPSSKERVVVHELGHLLGLPDLYSYIPGSDRWHYAGAWDVMSHGHGLIAWHRYKLGWLAKNQVACVSDGQKEYRLTQLNEKGGLKAVVAPITASDGSVTGAIVAEVRRKMDADSAEQRVCAEGVLVYEVWTTVESGMGPVRIKGPKTSAGSCDDSIDYIPLQVG